jgi:SprB-like repeat protein/type IX secretion system substrate protein
LEENAFYTFAANKKRKQMKYFTFKNQIKIALTALTLFICAESQAQVQLIHYWDMNNTLPNTGAGGTNINSANNTAPYSRLGGAKLVWTNSVTTAASCGCPVRDSIVDNNTSGSIINEYHNLGNDTGGTAAGNLYIKMRNPSANLKFLWYIPTTNYENIVISYASELSSAGKAINAYSYSLDGGLTYSTTGLPATSYTPGTAWAKQSISLSSIPGANNNPNFIFAIANTSTANITTSGNCRFDNIAVQGDSVSVSISSHTNIACFGGATGAATALTYGGTGSFTYTWAPSGGNAATASNLTAGVYTVSAQDVSGTIVTATVNITQSTAISAVLTSTNVNCFGNSTGSASTNVSGGAGGYTYTWSPSGGNASTASGLAQGSYTLSILDASSCPSNTMITITQPAAALSAVISGTNVNCFGNSTGSAMTTVSGGTSGYTYTWSPSGGNTATASGLAQGSYTVNITDANGCTTNTMVTITQPVAALSITATGTNVNCFGNSTGIASATVGGGTSGYTYTWSPSGGNAATASSLAQGTYTLNITDANSCTTNTTVTLTQPAAALTASISASNSVTCNGGSNGSATISVSGGTSGYTYTWSPSGGNAAHASGLVQGTYTINVKDANGCTANTNVAIAQPATAPMASITASNNVTCFGLSNGTATVSGSGGTSPYTYSWSNGQTSATATNLSATATLKLIHYWDMNNTLPATGAGGVTVSPLAAGYSTLGGAKLVYNNAATTKTSCGCTVRDSLLDNGTAGSTFNEFPVLGNDSSGTAAGNLYIRTRNPSANLPFLWYLPTTHYKNIVLSYAAELSSAGKAVHSYSYSLDSGVTFTTANLPMTTYTPGVAWATQTLNLSAIAGANNNPKFVFAILNTAPTATATGGNARFDNISVQGDTITAGPTYTATVIDANGCTNTAVVTITQPAVLTASVSSSTNVNCFNGNTGSATASISGGNTSFTYTWSPSGGNAATASSLTAGNYTINVTDNKGCTASNTVTITQPTTAVTASITANTNEQCNGSSNATATAVATGGTPAYTYTWSPSGGNTAVGSSLSAGTYTLNVTDNKGCPASATVTITQPNVMTASVTSFTNVNCNGNSNGAATSPATGGSGTYTYQWNDAGNQTTATAINLPAGTYNCFVTDVTCGTLVTTTVTITQPNVMTASVTSFTNVTCFGNNTGAATVAATAGSGTYTYQWNDVSNQTTATAINLVAGTYTCVVKDVTCGTTITKIVTITQPASSPTITIAGVSAICAGSSTTFTASGVNTYTWTSGPTTATYSVNPTATTSYSVVGTNSVGCTSSMAVVTLTVNTLPIVTINGTSSSTVAACANTTGTLTANGASTYTWSPGNSHATSITGSLTSTIGFTLTGTDVYGCVNSATELITVNPSPTVTVNSATVCAGTTTTLTANGAITYTWNSGATGTTITPSPTVITNYTVTGTDGNNCTNTAITTVIVNALPTININSPAICVGATDTLTATGATSYTWNTGATGATIIDSPTLTTNYTVTGTDGNNCINAGVATITVNSLPTLTITASSATVCAGITATLTASGANTYTWSNTGTTGTTISPSLTVTTNYTVTGTDGNNCMNTDTLSIMVNNCTTGIENNSANSNQLSVYPIPNNGAFTIELADDDYQMIKVYDEIGKEIYSQSLDGSAKNKSLKIDLSGLPNMNGMLTLQIITTSGVINKKIIIQK